MALIEIFYMEQLEQMTDIVFEPVAPIMLDGWKLLRRMRVRNQFISDNTQECLEPLAVGLVLTPVTTLYPHMIFMLIVVMQDVGIQMISISRHHKGELKWQEQKGLFMQVMLTVPMILFLLSEG